MRLATAAVDRAIGGLDDADPGNSGGWRVLTSYIAERIGDVSAVAVLRAPICILGAANECTHDPQDPYDP